MLNLLLKNIFASTAQIFRFSIVGLISNLCGYLIYLLITMWGVEPKTAMSFLYFIGAAIGFIGNHRWTFAHNGTLLDSGSKYLIAHLLGYLMNFSILYVFVDIFGYAHQLVQAVAIIIIAGLLFVSFKYFVFKENKPRCKDEE